MHGDAEAVIDQTLRFGDAQRESINSRLRESRLSCTKEFLQYVGLIVDIGIHVVQASTYNIYWHTSLTMLLLNDSYSPAFSTQLVIPVLFAIWKQEQNEHQEDLMSPISYL